MIKYIWGKELGNDVFQPFHKEMENGLHFYDGSDNWIHVTGGFYNKNRTITFTELFEIYD